MQARAGLERDGFFGPSPVFTRAECRRIAEHLRRADLSGQDGWEKALAVRDRFLYDLATRPSILERVTATLGPDVILWGVSVVARAPGQTHSWHSDIESCGTDGGFVSVWIGIENTSRDSSLQLIAGTHRLGKSVQEIRATTGIARDDATPERLLVLALEHDDSVALVQPDAGDGEAIFFDGRLWHGSDNRRRRGERIALLFQYAAADRPVRIPDWDELDWPFRIKPEPLPPVILVSGSAGDAVNDVVPPPSETTTPAIGAIVHRLELPLDDAPSEPWRPFPAFRSPTPVVSEMSCHASVLDAGHSPHAPHAHAEEELLIPLHGEVELVVPESASDAAPIERLTPGAFVYYPSGQLHTIRNPGSSPVAYLMFKWRAPVTRTESVLGTEIVRFDGAALGSAEAFRTEVVLEGATACLEKLHSHVTVLEPGASYEAHRDAHDVAIVLLEGEIETLGRRVRPPSVVYCSAGELHGMRNPGTEPARYLVFEFHARGGGTQPSRSTSFVRRLASKLRRARARRP